MGLLRFRLSHVSALFSVLLMALPPSPVDMAVPIEVQHPLFLKILSYDRKLPARVGPEIVVGIVYQSRYRPSVAARDGLARVMEATSVRSVKDIPVRYVSIELSSPEALAKSIKENHLDVLYVCPLRAFEAEAVALQSRRAGITTLTGMPAYVEAGLAIGIDLRDGRPEILVNLPAAKAEGAEFSAKLLKLARIVKK